MSESYINTAILAGVFLVLFASAEVLYHRLKVKAEFTRKYVHFSTGFITLLFPPLISNHWLVLALCGSFAVILTVSERFGFLKSITGIDRKSYGSILYPLVVYGSYLMFDHYHNLVFFYVPVLTLAVADPVAALLGKKLNWKPFTFFGNTKTLGGSVGFFFAALLITIISMLADGEITGSTVYLIAAVVALVTTIAEAFSHKGFDNLSIPASAIVVLMLFEKWM